MFLRYLNKLNYLKKFLLSKPQPLLIYAYIIYKHFIIIINILFKYLKKIKKIKYIIIDLF